MTAQPPHASTSREIYPHEEESLQGSSRFSWLKWDLTPSEWDILLVSTCIKLLLFPA
jgi:alpha-1,3-glucosyltransferase